MGDIMGISVPMKPLGTTCKRRQGDWEVTYEVVGWNERCQCNTWAEKNRKWHPRPNYEWFERCFEEEELTRRSRALRQRLTEKMKKQHG